MAQYSQFDEAAVSAMNNGVGSQEAGKKRKSKANKLTEEEIKSLTPEELENYIMNEGFNKTA